MTENAASVARSSGSGAGALTRRRKREFLRSLPCLFLILPATLYLIVFNYLPMFGIVIAFKEFNYRKGIFGSDWVGLENFQFFFTSQDALRVTLNTVLYSVAFIVTGMLAAIFIALLLYEVKSKGNLKYFQTTMILPHFLSWVVVAYMVYVLFNPNYGLANQLVRLFGGEEIGWYMDPSRWPWIFIFVNIWKSIGMNSIIYYAALMGIDESLFEAAQLDGANRIKQIRHISLPSLIPIVCILLIMSVGGIMRGDFGLFYQVPMDVGALYPTTDIIDTYIYRGLRQGNMSVSAAVGLFQSLVGLILVVSANALIRKLSNENSMF